MKKEVMVGWQEFKCRRCSAVFRGELDRGDYVKYMTGGETAAHPCDDGGIGLGDFIGLTPLEQATAKTRKHRVSRSGPETYSATTYTLGKGE